MQTRLGNQPVYLTGFAKDWPAMQKWNLSWFLAQFGSLDVGINAGAYERSPAVADLAFSRPKQRGRFAAYLKDILAGRKPKGYLAAHSFAEGFESLSSDVDLPNRAPRPDLESKHFWISAPGTVTQLHFDRAHNILVQIFGTKRIELYAPGRELNPVRVIGNWVVDVSAWEIDGPVTTLPPPDVVCDLQPGDALYIPYGWWHKVTSIGACASVNHWWWDRKALLFRIPDLLSARLRVWFKLKRNRL